MTRQSKVKVATYFKSLTLKNVRCFEDVCLDLADETGNIAQWTLLLGDNGVGKTTLLQCLCWMRPDLKGDEESSSENDPDFSKPLTEERIGANLLGEQNDLLEALRRIGKNFKVILGAELWQGIELNSSKIVERRNLKSKEIKTKVTITFKEDGSLKEDPEDKEIDIKKDLGEFWEPFIVAYGANRSVGPKSITTNKIVDSFAANFSVEGTELQSVEETLITLQYAADDKKLKRYENSRNGIANEEESDEEQILKIFKQAIIDVLPDEERTVNDIVIEAPKYVKGEIKDAEVKLRIFDVDVPFSQLSLGYQTTIALVLDLCWQLFTRYPKNSDPLSVPAIVLIDELDLHLHPRWQLEIMRKLAMTFKRTQFIATAHSPLMVQAMPNANFAIVHKIDEVNIKIENEPEKVQGWRIDQILGSQYFGIRFPPDPEVEELFKQRDKLLLKQNRTSKDEEQLDKLERQILKISKPAVWEDREAFELLRQAVKVLGKKEEKK